MTASLMQPNNSLPAPQELLDLLPSALLVVANEAVLYANKTASELGLGRLEKLLVDLCKGGKRVSIYDHMLRIGSQQLVANIHIQPMEANMTMVVIHPHSAVSQHQHASSWKEEITRASGVMAAMLAHEVKNPLSSIRGAAQLLRENASEAEKPLAELICNETLRIRDLLDRMEIFSDDRAPELAPLNIHEVIQYAMKVAKAGFASHIKFIERYDPSLPLVHSQRELLVQLFLNLIKNATEAMSAQKTPTITLSTGYKSGYRLRDTELPIFVQVSDNGPGIPEAIRAKLFEPFATSKEQGRGLGLAVVAKIAGDLGLVVQLDERQTQGAGFVVYLPKIKLHVT